MDKATAEKLRAFAAPGREFAYLGESLKELALILADAIDPAPETTEATAPAAPVIDPAAPDAPAP